MMYQTPGVYKEEIFATPVTELLTGVPAFIGLVAKSDIAAYADRLTLTPLDTPGLWLVKKPGGAAGEARVPDQFTNWQQFAEALGNRLKRSYLPSAVRGFFENDGRLCYTPIICFESAALATQALQAGLDALETLDTVDLIAAPDILYPRTYQAGQTELQVNVDEALRLQRTVLEHCDTFGTRFAIFDSLPKAGLSDVLAQRRALAGTNGAVYYPWIHVADAGFVPPCGHVAGVYSRSDRQTGIHKAPANETLEGALDLETNLTDADQGRLNPEGVNCLRALRGRGLRVWGARTVSADPNWTYVNVRRLFTTAARWIERSLIDVTFEPNGFKLWVRIQRELNVYFEGLLRQGALKGATPDAAFYIKCDADTNPPEVRDAGMVVTEIGLAPAVPNEFIVVRLLHGGGGITISTPAA